MSKEYEIEYKPIYLKGYFPIKHRFKRIDKVDLTPNEYFDKYVKKTEGYESEDDFGRRFERILNMDDNQIYLYKVTEEYKYLIAILPNKK